jgi:lipopolysaccharide exporter
MKSPAMTGSLALGATHIAKIGLRLISSVILTRLLYPEAFGYMAIVMSAVLIISLSTDIGIKPFLIRYQGAISQSLQDVIWTLKVLRGAILYTVMIAISGVLADFYGDPKIETLLRIVATSSLLQAASPLSLYWAEKEKKFTLVAGAEFAAFLAQTISVLIITYIFRSYWCLAFGAVVNSLTLFLIASHMSGYKYPKFSLRWDYIKEIWSFIKWITFGSLVFVTVMQADRFVIGKVFNAEVLGFYAIALTIAEALTTMAQNVANRIGFPTWADARKQGKVEKSFSRFSRVFIPVAGMASGALVLLAQDVVSILYDERYAIAGVLLAVLGIRAVLIALLTTTVDLLIVDGKSRAMFTANVIRLLWVVVMLSFVWGSGDVRLYALVFATIDLLPILFYAMVAKGYRHLFALNILYAVLGFSAGCLLGYLGSQALQYFITVI